METLLDHWYLCYLSPSWIMNGTASLIEAPLPTRIGTLKLVLRFENSFSSEAI
ncbi:unnamed protein product [Arabidopsis halleri]